MKDKCMWCIHFVKCEKCEKCGRLKCELGKDVNAKGECKYFVYDAEDEDIWW